MDPADPADPADGGGSAEPMDVDGQREGGGGGCRRRLDCYPYAFSPLLLFAPDSYFDSGLSNYHAVARFFAPTLAALGGGDGDGNGNGNGGCGAPFDMLHNVVHEGGNLLYEDLLAHIIANESLVTCCIDAHFTAFQMLRVGGGGSGEGGGVAMVRYDPLRSGLSLYTGGPCREYALFLLMKCKYGDGQHIQDNREHYVGQGSNQVRRVIHSLWRRINKQDSIYASPTAVALNLDRYVLVNHSPANPGAMSTQLTGNTCYFQTYLFALLCKVGGIALGGRGRSLDVLRVERLEEAARAICRFVLEFFAGGRGSGGGGTGDTPAVLRPLTNCNVVVDFYRYAQSPYYRLMTRYLAGSAPDYEDQYRETLRYFREEKCLHGYDRFGLVGAMQSSPNSKSLQVVKGTEDAFKKLSLADYYKFRAANFMFGFNSNVMGSLSSFCLFNSFRKNQLLRFYRDIEPALRDLPAALARAGGQKEYRDYYFMPQYEVGQQELINLHHYTFLIDLCAGGSSVDNSLRERVNSVNSYLLRHVLFSTSKRHNYDKIVSAESYKKQKKSYRSYLDSFMSVDFFNTYIGLGFTDVNPNEKEINNMTQTVFYTSDLAQSQMHRMEYEFEKESVNQMARSTLRKYSGMFGGSQDILQKYKVNIKIGMGYTYSKYNTLMHFLNVMQSYWRNPDLSNISIFGKDVRTLLAISSQKIFFDEKHRSGYYHYGPFEKETSSSYYSSSPCELDLAVATWIGHAAPSVSRRSKKNSQLVITDRAYEFGYLKEVLEGVFSKANGEQLKSDNEVLNLCLLSLMLDFGLLEKYVGLLNLPLLHNLQHKSDTRELQVEIANSIYEFDRKNTADFITRSRVEELIFETSHKFLVNKDFSVQSPQFKLIRALNSDSDYQAYVLLVKIYMSLCQINKSVEVDYYKVRCDGEFRIIIPQNFSKTTSNYLEQITNRYTFSENGGIMTYDDLPVFDLRPHQPEINLYAVRLDSATDVQSMFKYVEIKNVFRILDESKEKYLIFVADNSILIEVANRTNMNIRVNNISVEVANLFFNEAISFLPCFRYIDGEDIVLFTSRNMHFHVDNGGQFHTDYYGMRHELIECINSEESFVDLNDDHVFKRAKLSELLTESKTVLYFPDYLLQVPNRQELINLLDLALHLRNVSFFILVLFYLERSSVEIVYETMRNKKQIITGPWYEAICYVLSAKGRADNAHYDSIFEKQFFDLNHYQNMPLDDFIDNLCENFTKYQRFSGGRYQIIPTQKQKAFLKRLVCAEECFHFSEVGTGKTKVILPLLCQTFLSNNADAHKCLARGGKKKDVLVVLVPEHLVSDARTQVFRYCLNLNFRQKYYVHDEIFALKHKSVVLGDCKRIFVTSFNQFKKALTDDVICTKVFPRREHFLVVADEVDDFLDRDKLVFNICSNKSNAFERPTLGLFYEVSHTAYHGLDFPDMLLESSPNPEYWTQLSDKFRAIHLEIQDASRSINKNFGIFNEHTLRHCNTNIAHDIEGYKSLIARPYESVNRAMPGSYYSDVERTIYLTYVILTEDISKYDELFAMERKFISYEYWNEHFVNQLDFDDLVYGHEKLLEICDKSPDAKDGLVRFLYEIILRKMEIRDKSRSVNSIDIIFNFDCIGFTGTPFLDNYPTADYIRLGRRDGIPDMIRRDFYAYSSETLKKDEFEQRFARFQGQNSNVMAQYVSSDFLRTSQDEMATLEAIFSKEEEIGNANGAGHQSEFNAIVDLCGIFKRSTIQDVCELIRNKFGSDRFHYLYHIDQSDNSDRVLCIKTGNDIQYDEEFYKFLCKTYDSELRKRIFFFVDNRNVIGKDIPFQLVYQRHFGQALFNKSVIIAHDVDDFSKIWQAMGRSRTMNQTEFSIYKNDIPEGMGTDFGVVSDIKKQDLTRLLYITNCDRKMAGNISSIYMTLIALFNLSQRMFYYRDDIVNVFLEKMEDTIATKVGRHEKQLIACIMGNSQPARILHHILMDKFKRSSSGVVADALLEENTLKELLCHIVQQKYEQRAPSDDIFDDLLHFLSGEQKSLMEISYTKQHQKQKQKQQNKNQNSDAMALFDKKHRLPLSRTVADYFDSTKDGEKDWTKSFLNQPISVPILTLDYSAGGRQGIIDVYPTIQFLYSHHVNQEYITDEVKGIISEGEDPKSFYEAVKVPEGVGTSPSDGATAVKNQINVETNHIKQNPQYTIAALEPGVYIIGMKDQFNIFDLHINPLKRRVQYVMDESGHVLYDRTASKDVDSFGPYFIEQYIIMEILSKQEIAQNVMDYYLRHKETIQRGLESYDEKQGKGFVCWRFLINETAKAMAKESKEAGDTDAEMSENSSKRKHWGEKVDLEYQV